MHDQVVELIRHAVAASRHPDDVVPVRVCDLKDFLDAWSYFEAARASTALVNADGTPAAAQLAFTKRLERFKLEGERAVIRMNTLFERVEPEGRARLCQVFSNVVSILRKVADETMAVHREHFQCAPKETK